MMSGSRDAHALAVQQHPAGAPLGKMKPSQLACLVLRLAEELEEHFNRRLL